MHKTSTKEKKNENIKRQIPNRKVGLNNNYDIEVQKRIGNNSLFMVMKTFSKPVKPKKIVIQMKVRPSL